MRRQLAVVSGAVTVLTVLAAAIGGTGVASAATSAPASASAAVRAARAEQALQPAGAARRHGHEQFRLTSHSATSRKQALRARGVLDASGHAEVGSIVAGRARVWLVFRHGWVHMVTYVSGIRVTNPTRACRFTETQTGAYRIRGGTRRYAHASGAGSYVTNISGRLKRKRGECTTALAYFYQTTTTSGSFSW